MSAKIPRWLIATIAVPMISSGLSSCGRSVPSQAEGVPLIKELQAEVANVKEIQPPALPPSQVVLHVDQSGSINLARVAPMSYSDVEPVLKALSETGGTFAMGAICDRSNRPLVRTTFPEAPRMNLNSIPTPPDSPDTTRGNPYKNRERLKQYEEAMAAYQDKATPIKQQLIAYQQELQQHQAENHQRIEDLQPQIETLLNQPRNCQHTDIQSAVERANLLFDEPPAFSQPPRTYAVFLTDGLDSFSSQPAQLNADSVLLVNGSGDMGIFQSVDHKRFESPTAALTVLAQWIQQ